MKERIQVLAAQQRTNLADVNHKEARTSSDSYYLDSVNSIMQKFGDVKDIYDDKKRSLNWERECQIQFLAQVLPIEGSYSNVLAKENLVNSIFADGERFTRRIKTADQAIYADSEISRVASLILQNGGSHVQLKGINAQALNQNYNKNNILSIKDLHFQNGDETLDLASEVKEAKIHEETVNEVAGVGFAPTIRTLRMRVSSTRLRASPTTENSMAQESKYVNEKERIQVPAAQQRINFAEVNHREARTSSDSYYLDSADSIMHKFGDVKDVYNDKKITDWSNVSRVYFPIDEFQSANNTILRQSDGVNKEMKTRICGGKYGKRNFNFR